MKYDIKVANNGIGGRQGFAYVCNSGEIKVLMVDLEAPQTEYSYKTYGKVKVEWNGRNGRKLHKACTLVCDNGAWELTSGGTFISGSFGYDDAMAMIKEAQLQVLGEGDIVAIARYTSKGVMLHLYKVGRIDPHCITTATLKDLDEDEMAEVVRNANRWLNR